MRSAARGCGFAFHTLDGALLEAPPVLPGGALGAVLRANRDLGIDTQTAVTQGRGKRMDYHQAA